VKNLYTIHLGRWDGGILAIIAPSGIGLFASPLQNIDLIRGSLNPDLSLGHKKGHPVKDGLSVKEQV
jgi:hypothetical protein